MWLVALGWVVLWIVFLAWIDRGQKSQPYPVGEVSEQLQVVIPFRNEAHRLPACLRALNNSHGLAYPLHVILIDDRSADASVEWVRQHQDRFERLHIQLHTCQGRGKKEAILTGLSQCDERWTYITDADCTVQPTTIQRLVAQAKADSLRVVFGPVSYTHTSLFTRWVAYEHLNTQAVAKAFLSVKQPIAVNAANMLVHPSMLEEYRASLNNHFASGDDMFFAEHLDSSHWGEAFVKEAIVQTEAPDSLRELFHQRVRWASKYRGYASWANRLLPPLIFLWSSGFVAMIAAAVLAPVWLNGYLLLWLSKTAVEAVFHARWFALLGQRVWPWDTFVVSLVYPFYFVVIGLSSLLTSSFQWKGRTVRVSS